MGKNRDRLLFKMGWAKRASKLKTKQDNSVLAIIAVTKSSLPRGSDERSQQAILHKSLNFYQWGFLSWQLIAKVWNFNIL